MSLMIGWLIKDTPFKLSQSVRQWSGNAKARSSQASELSPVFMSIRKKMPFGYLIIASMTLSGDGKTKIEHVLEMLGNCHYQKKLPFGTVLMDTW